MKILGFSDLHRDVAAARMIVEASGEADIIVGAGDFATKGKGAGETIEILKAARCPTILVSGNHDRHAELKQLCSDWSDGHLLHGQSIVLEGVPFFGLGGEIPKRNEEHWNEALDEGEASKMLVDCPRSAVVVTHTPPKGYADLQRNGAHEGSVAILKAIHDKQPLLNLCGHIHYSWGAAAMVGDTRIYNLGPTLNWFEI
ncbi:MAG: metallophosphoesterase family protein [Alphaproteobacteria bacterium]